MKFALPHAKKNLKDTIIISFFFNARGDDLEKSTIGMYRSLLFQLLDRVPELQNVFDDFGSTLLNNNRFYGWAIEILKELFSRAIQKLGQRPLTCFIDALDECEEDQIRDTVNLFQELGEVAVSARIRFHVCFSSRHYPCITIMKGLHLILDDQEGHNQDIATYLHGKLRIGHSKQAEQIRVQLLDKASGISYGLSLSFRYLTKSMTAVASTHYGKGFEIS